MQVTLDLPFEFEVDIQCIGKWYEEYQYQWVPKYIEDWMYIYDADGLSIGTYDRHGYFLMYQLSDCFLTYEEAEAECERRNRSDENEPYKEADRPAEAN